MDFSEELKNLMSNFNGEFKPLQNEFQNLKKTSDAIKVSMLSRFDEVRSKMIEEAELVLNLLNTLNIPWIRGLRGFRAHRYYGDFRYFSIIKSSDLCSLTESYFAETDGKLCAIYMTFKSKTGDEVNTVRCNGFSNNFDNYNKERIIAMYDSGEYHKCLLGTARNFLDYVIEVYKNDINFYKNVIQNSSYQSECNTNWNEYIMYILKWASEHTDESNFGDSPKSYIEWKNEVAE